MTAIGIDLGTSNTVVAHFKDGDPHTLSDPAGRRLIPSIISFHPSGTVLVGDSAKMRRFNDGLSTVTGAKRLMGRLWGSPELEEMRKRVPYQLREGKNRTVRALLRGELYSMPELSAFVLRKAKAWAEEALGAEVTEAVITVPANFNELQRQATKLAGELAGLEVLRVLNEPTAAALAYGHIAPVARDEQIAVYDFGGGTFDLTMLHMSEHELRVRGTAGDMFLGGDDIDLAIATKIAVAYLANNRYDPRADPEVFARVRIAAERLKVELSSSQEATVPLNELMYGPGGKPIHWSYSMTRKELDAVLDPFVDQSLKVCEEAMKLLKVTPRSFDRVVLVGGTTLSPRIRQRVSDFFGRDPVKGLDPEEAVALGAAISSTMPVARKVKKSAPVRIVEQGPVDLTDELVEAPDEPMESFPISQRFGPPQEEEEVLVRSVSTSGAAAAAKPPEGSSPAPAGRSRLRVGAGIGAAALIAAASTMAWLHLRHEPTTSPPPRAATGSAAVPVEPPPPVVQPVPSSGPPTPSAAAAVPSGAPPAASP